MSIDRGLDPRTRDQNALDRGRVVDIDLLGDDDRILDPRLRGLVPSVVLPRIITPMERENVLGRIGEPLLRERVRSAVNRADVNAAVRRHRE